MLPFQNFLQRKYDERQIQHDLINEQILRLRKSFAIETSVAERFKLEKQIEQAEADRDKVQEELEILEKRLQDPPQNSERLTTFSSLFDTSYYVDTVINQFENWQLSHKEPPIIESIFRSDLFNTYVDLGATDEEEQYYDSLFNITENWLVDEKRESLVLLGDYGSGKTSFCIYLIYQLLIKLRNNPNKGIFPIYLSFRDIFSESTPEHTIFEILTNKYGIPIEGLPDFLYALQQGDILLILDGFDEIVHSSYIEQIQRKFLELREILLFSSKTIITCRTNYFYSGEDVRYVFPLSSESMDLLDSIVSHRSFELFWLADFDQKRQEEYLTNVIEDKEYLKHVWERIKKIYDLPDLSRRPILLSMIAKTFDVIEKADTTITATFLYDAFTNAWLRREFLTHRSDIPISEKRHVLELLSIQLFERNLEQIHKDELRDFLEQSFYGKYNSQDIAQILYDFTTCSFLMRTQDQHLGFVHRSFLEFFVSRALLREIMSGRPQLFGRQRLFGVVVNFLVELIQKENKQQDVKGRLEQWIGESSRIENANAHLGGNSAALLVRLGYSFQRKDLSGVVLRNADLTNGDFRNCNLRDANFDGATLTHSDFSGSNLQNANLSNVFLRDTIFRQCNLQNASLKNLRLIGGPDTIWNAAFTPDKHNIAVGTDRGDFMVFRFLEEGIQNHTTFHVDDSGVLHFAFSADGNFLAITDRNRKIYLFSEPQKGIRKPLRIFGGNTDNVRWVDFSPRGDILASGGRDHLVKLWYLTGRSQVKNLLFHAGPIMCTIWSPDGAFIASAGYDQNICLWHIDGKLITPQHLIDSGDKTSHNGVIRALAFSSTGEILASGGEDAVVKLWHLHDLESPTVIANIDADVFCLEFVDNNKTLLVGCADGSVRRFNLSAREQTHSVKAHDDIIRSFSVDNELGYLLTSSWDGSVKLWHLNDLSFKSEIIRLDGELLSHEEGPFTQANITGVRDISKRLKLHLKHLGAYDLS